jgi:hypothetical protein
MPRPDGRGASLGSLSNTGDFQGNQGFPFLPQRPPRGGGKLLRPQPVPLVVSGCIPGRLQENTDDLQWKIDADYNARPCDSERKAGGARTMGNNEKAMERAMETVGDPDRGLCPVVRRRAHGRLMDGRRVACRKAKRPAARGCGREKGRLGFQPSPNCRKSASKGRVILTYCDAVAGWSPRQTPSAFSTYIRSLTRNGRG